MFFIARHRLTASQPTVCPLEIFPSAELASLAFQLRATHRKPGMYHIPEQWPGSYLHDDDTDDKDEYRFAQADTTGLMAVWPYGGQRHFDSTLLPEELWYMERGQVFRARWLVALGDEWNKDLQDVTRPDAWPHTSVPVPRLDMDALEAARTHRND